ncbi:phospholipid-binding protein MlaC [Catenovulum maritimum]|uniref:Toluene tolerance protein n=1 Tax=Catenovulum maritimum TaxID=1513271 RepID=A0A0J8GUS0_9ALTE|nr:ABC transporter substrate-binding protein [Catenovulum maritimum]KMT65029.1 hypothetical protein XM47_11140 [Catenovulum maritimum]
MKKILTSLFACFALLSFTFGAQADTNAQFKNDDPYELFRLVTEKAFQRFKQDWPKVEQDPELLKVIIREELLPYIDYEYASFKVLGKHTRGPSRDELMKFVDAFRDYIVTVYAQLFINYRSEQTIIVEPSNSKELDKIVVVKSKIVEPGRPDIAVTFKLINRGKGWQAFDMEAEGISVLSTKRKEIGDAISRIGFKAVINDLIEKADKKLNFKSDDKNVS